MMTNNGPKKQCGGCRHFHRPERRELNMGECRWAPPQIAMQFQQGPGGQLAPVNMLAFPPLPETHAVCGQFAPAPVGAVTLPGLKGTQ